MVVNDLRVMLSTALEIIGDRNALPSDKDKIILLMKSEATTHNLEEIEKICEKYKG